MGYYEYDTGYYEPSIADEIFDEAKEKLKSIISSEIQDEINNIKQENIRLNKEIEQYRAKERELRNREIEIERKEKWDINELYKEKWSETLKPLEENFTGWEVGFEQVKKGNVINAIKIEK